MNSNPIFWAILVLIGVAVGYLIRHLSSSRLKNSIEEKVKRQFEEAKSKAKEIVLEAQEKSASIIEETKKEERERKLQIDKEQERIIKKEETIEKQLSDLRVKEEELGRNTEDIKKEKSVLEELKKKADQEVEKRAGLTPEQAKTLILDMTKEKYQEDLVSTMQKLEKERKEEVEKKILEILLTAIGRYSRSHISEITTSVFPLENEDLKGKIIGREGRNIKALERATGVEFIIDEAPDYIVISSFDPMRREIANLALKKLVKDGRIQPARIEEKVEEAKQEINKRVNEIGEEAVYEVGIYDLPKEIIQLVGRLHFRTSYGQNALVHSIEVAHLSAMIASELGINADVAKKAGLLHDIGKAIDHEVQGNHVELGQKILKKYGVAEDVIEAMMAHHEDYPFSTPESFVIAAADALSAARPGARRENMENYIKRLEDLEKIATGFGGVKSAFAISGGREIRIFVTPEKIDDFGAFQLARDIAAKIEGELKYPGEIKVNIIREVRAVEYAK